MIKDRSAEESGRQVLYPYLARIAEISNADDSPASSLYKCAHHPSHKQPFILTLVLLSHQRGKRSWIRVIKFAILWGADVLGNFEIPDNSKFFHVHAFCMP